MRKPADPLRKEGPKPKAPPRWRDLTDEQRWERIYKDRELRKATAPKTVAEAVALAFPAYVLQMAIDDCQRTFAATVRGDVHVAIVSTIARVATRLQRMEDREAMLVRLQKHYLDLKGRGFYLDNREFLYANAAALVRLVDDFRFPPDAPVVGAAILLKEDAEEYDQGDWKLNKSHAIKMVAVAYDQFLDTGLYAYPSADSPEKLH